MRQIGQALEMYQTDHANTLPNRLSELVPLYLANADVLFTQTANGSRGPYAASPDPRVIDAFSSYAVVRFKEGGFIVFEKPSPWKDNSIGYVYRLTADGPTQPLVIGRASPRDFERLVLPHLSEDAKN